MKRSLFPIGLALAGTLLVPTLGAAQARSQAPQKPMVRGPFDVRLLATLEPNQVFHPSSGADGKMRPAAPATVVARGKKVTAVLFLKDCKPDASGNCNVDVDLQGTDPTGKMFENKKGAELWRNKKAPPAGIVQLGSQVMNIQLELRDPVGVYKIVAVAHDRVAGTEKRVETSFEVK